MRSMLMVGIVLLGGAAQAASMATDAAGHELPVPMSVRAVGQYQGQSVVLLEDGAGQRRLPIWVGDLEAGAIDMRLKKQKYPRPLTHDLMEATLTAIGAKIEKVEVIDLRDNVYYGRLTVRDAKGTSRVIDARPSDCIALALGAGLPVLVAPSVLRAAAIDAP
jgi:bifunctional DNase/RNase